ncbi:MAG: branched-chain amino acid ABC transporter permease [Ruminococcus sp.]|nr:branched-chain amino acid ABC transporter permease [Ruminococcus sp.]
MQIDIVKAAEIIGAASVILSVIIGGYKLYDKLTDRLTELERRAAALEQENRSIKKENTLVIYALGACLDGLHQQGCNGKVTEAMEKISKYINNAAHDQN